MTLAEEKKRQTGGGGDEGKEKKEKLQNVSVHHYLQNTPRATQYLPRDRESIEGQSPVATESSP